MGGPRARRAAVIDGRQRSTYSEINALADQFCHRMVEAGVRSGECVAVLLPRSTMLMLLNLLSRSSALSYVPLSQDDPDERTSHILRDSGAALLVAGASTGDSIPVLVSGTRIS